MSLLLDALNRASKDKSAAEASVKVCRNGSKAANSIVVSSDTRNVAMQATQNTGQGEEGVAPGRGGAWAVAMLNPAPAGTRPGTPADRARTAAPDPPQRWPQGRSLGFS